MRLNYRNHDANWDRMSDPWRSSDTEKNRISDCNARMRDGIDHFDVAALSATLRSEKRNVEQHWYNIFVFRFSVQNIFIYICIKCCSSFLVHMVNITMFVVGSSIATVHTDIRKPQTNFKHQNAWVGIRGVYIPYLFLNVKAKTGFLHGEDCWTWKAIAQGGMEQTFWSGKVSPSIFFHKRHAVCTARFPRAAHASTGRGCAL